MNKDVWINGCWGCQEEMRWRWKKRQTMIDGNMARLYGWRSLPLGGEDDSILCISMVQKARAMNPLLFFVIEHCYWPCLSISLHTALHSDLLYRKAHGTGYVRMVFSWAFFLTVGGRDFVIKRWWRPCWSKFVEKEAFICCGRWEAKNMKRFFGNSGRRGPWGGE